jgi:hypothetical protein
MAGLVRHNATIVRIQLHRRRHARLKEEEEGGHRLYRSKLIRSPKARWVGRKYVRMIWKFLCQIFEF